MKSQTLIALTLLLAACEGEPPKTAAGEVSGSPQPSPPAPAAFETDEQTHSANNNNRNQNNGECCNCGCAHGAPVAAAGDGGAPQIAEADGGGGATAASAEADAAAPAVARNDVIGTVSATPSYLASAAVVWLEDAPKEPGRGMHARIDNHQMTFSPMIQVITVGGTVTFVNNDPFPHNVFSPDGDKFNMGSIAQNSSSPPHKFDRVGTYTLLCNLHPSMLGYLVVAPSSYYARTDARGHFRLKDVPAGTYKITAWAPRLPTVTQSVTVGATEAKADFELHR
jgi:plastocyanin